MSKVRVYKRNGKMNTGVAWLILLCVLLIYNYLDYALTIGIFVLITYLIIRKVKSKDTKNITLMEIDNMTGEQFEYYLTNLFKAKGYSAYKTKSGGDQGADVIISKNGERTVVQAKRYKNSVGNSAVQEVVASIRYYNANHAMVVTNSYFTQAAKDLARVNNVELIDRNGLKRLIAN